MTRGLKSGLNAGSRQGKCFLHESKYVLWTLEGKMFPVTHCWGQRILVLPQPSLKFSYNLDEVVRSKGKNHTKNSHLTLFTVVFFPHSLVIFFFFAKCQLDYSLSALIQTYCWCPNICVPWRTGFKGCMSASENKQISSLQVVKVTVRSTDCCVCTQTETRQILLSLHQ